MRRTLVLVAAGLLVLTMTAPASAASKNVLTVEIDCSNSNVPALGVFTVDAVGLPGWPDRTLSMTPIHFRGPSGVEIWENGVKIEEIPGWLPPPGLQDSGKLVGPCEMHLFGGSRATFDVEWHDTYYFFPRPME
jgi:hypothetical protein